jgi:CO/xanthine dehydrogenase Mo-binding subunit
MNERELSRKSFVKGGGALIVGFSLAGAAGKVAKAAAPTPAGYLPDLTKVDSWITINPDNTVTLKVSQIELGNGIHTGFSMVVAEELGVDLSQVKMSPNTDTWVVASTGGEGGSNAISGTSPKVRAAAAYAKQALFGLAATNLGVPASQLSVSKGVVSGGGKTVSYGTLVGGKLLSTTIPTASLTPGQAPAKAVKDYTTVGTSPQRIDIPDKVSGAYTYVHNIRVPGMLHGRVVRPRGQGAVTSQDYIPLSVDKTSIAHIPSAQVVQKGNFLGVVAPKEYDAIQAAAQLKVTWKSDPKLYGSGNFWKGGRAAADAAGTAKFTTDTGQTAGNKSVPSLLASAAKTVSASYNYQYNGHMSIGPTCAVADVQATGATVYCNAQSIQGVPTTLAPILNLPVQNIRAIFYEGSSSYGSNPTTDVYEAAAVMSQIVGKPVRLQYMRWDEHGYDNYGPATMYDVTGGVDANGNIVALDWVSYTQAGASVTPTTEATGFNTWPATAAVGAAGTSDTIYKVATTGKRVLAKSFPLYSGAFRSSSLRAPGAQQSHFAGEQIVDELAHAANMDPIAFRRQNIDPTTNAGQRWLAALDTAARISNWQPKVAASNLKSGNVVTGRGMAFGTFASTQVAMVADIELNKKTGKITAKHLYLAHNTGFTVSPGLVANQAMGSAIMGLSRAMLEELTFTKERITSLDWVTYPILRFADSPLVTVAIVKPGGEVLVTPGANQNFGTGNMDATSSAWAATGSGEPGSVPPGAAVANAFFDATGVRIRQAPMTPARVRALLKSAGTA